VYEQEADRVAEQVMLMPEPQIQRNCVCGGSCTKCQSEEEEQPPQEDLQMKHSSTSSNLSQATASTSVYEVLRSPGQLLDSATRAFMESRFGHDFSRVRIHSDPTAAQSAQGVNAYAYTVGNNIVFGTGQFAPRTHKGRRLIAHELTHVVQQSGLRGNNLGQRIDVSSVSTSKQTLQRMIPCRRHRDPEEDETAIEASKRIDVSLKILSSIYNDPNVDITIKNEMIEEIRLALVSLNNYIKVIKEQCESDIGGTTILGTTTTMPDPFSAAAAAAIAIFAAVVLGSTAARVSDAERQAVDNLGHSLTGMAWAVEAAEIARDRLRPSPVPPRIWPEPGRTPTSTSTSTPTSTPTPTPIPVPNVPPIPKPTDPDDERRRKRCPPIILLLPRAKAYDLDAYVALIGELEHIPNRPRDTNQKKSWETLTPGRIPASVWTRAAEMGLASLFVVFPFWSQTAVYPEPMQVDHDIEMQVTPIGKEGKFDTPAHHRLMDAGSNVGAGAELLWNIVKMRETLVKCTNDQGWMYRRLVFERVAASTSNNPGIWSRDDLISGRHLDAYERLGRPKPPLTQYLP
jgi:hypothetical protein